MKRRGGWSNGQATTVGGQGATTTLMTINKCAVSEAEDVCGGRGGGRPRLVSGDGGATVVRWWKRNSFVIRPWRMEVEDGQAGRGVHFFVELNPTFIPTLSNLSKNI